MGIRQDRSGRWRAELKSGREYVAGRTFDTKREAEAWLSRERASLAGGVDPRAGKVLVRKAFATWLVDREGTVAIKTTKADRSVLKALPPGVANLHVNPCDRSRGPAVHQRLVAALCRVHGEALPSDADGILRVLHP